MTATAVRIATRSRTLRVPHIAAAVPAARHVLVDDLQERDVPPEIVDEAELVVSELMTNALRHARPLADGTIRVHWQIKGQIVEIDVTDGGGGREPRPISASPYAQFGRGLRVVRALAHEWGVFEEERGQTVWVCLGGPSRRRRP
ncbi:MAG: ATP-binding protein [Actinomycetota bacterium]